MPNPTLTLTNSYHDKRRLPARCSTVTIFGYDLDEWKSVSKIQEQKKKQEVTGQEGRQATILHDDKVQNSLTARQFCPYLNRVTHVFWTADLFGKMSTTINQSIPHSWNVFLVRQNYKT